MNNINQKSVSRVKITYHDGSQKIFNDCVISITDKYIIIQEGLNTMYILIIKTVAFSMVDYATKPRKKAPPKSMLSDVVNPDD